MDSKCSVEVADSYKRLYEGDRAKVDLKSFLKSNIPPSEHKEIEDELKKTTRLEARGHSKPKVQPKRKSKFLTSKEKRILGLHKLPKRANLKVEDFQKLHQMWLTYIRKVIGSAKLADSKEKPLGVIRNLADEQLQMRLSRADFHGAFVKVVKSPNKELIGKEGYVAMETRNTLQIITEKGGVKTIPKAKTVVTFLVDGMLVSVSTTNMCIRPSERAVKKWKNKPPFEL